MNTAAALAPTPAAISPARPIYLQATQKPAYKVNIIESFIEYIDRKDSTVKGYITCLRQYAKWLNDNGIRLDETTREDIKAYRDHLAQSGLAVGTQQQYLRAVKQLYKWAASEGLYINIADNIHGAKVKNDCHKKDALPRDSVQVIADSIDRSDEQGKRLYAIFLLCTKCGLRTIEVTRANVEDLKTVSGDNYLYVQPKGHDGKDSAKYLIPEVKQAIDNYLQSRSEKVTPKSPLFTSTSNRKGHDKNGAPTSRIATTTISTMLKKLLVRNGFDSDRLTAHSLRATAATTAFEAGLTLFEVQQLMGHCDPATTEIYIKDQNLLQIEKKGRTAIDKFHKGEKTRGILPELEAEIMTLTAEQQKELLAQLRAQKGKV